MNPSETAERYDPRAEYERRLENRRVRRASLLRIDRLFSAGRLIAFGLICLVGFAALTSSGIPFSAAIPFAAIFVGLLIAHQPIVARFARASRAVLYYERGLARLDDRWTGAGSTGTEFNDEAHPYARDLDLFGRGSLFELISRARTRTGEATLARWLLEAADPDEIQARQVAVEELRHRIDLREDLDQLADAARSGVDSHRLAEWGGAAPVLTGAAAPIAAGVLALLASASLIGWGWFGITGLPFFAVALVEFAFSRVLRGRVEATVKNLDKGQGELRLLALVLKRLEAESFDSPKLAGLLKSIGGGDVLASDRLHRLGRLIAMLEDGRRNALFIPLAMILLWTIQIAHALDRWRTRNGPSIEQWLHAVGEFEALCSLATYAYENPADPFPEIAAGGPTFQAVDLRHPLLPRAQAIGNDIELGGERRLFLISGSNMSGKSTWLRTIGVNTALALAGAPIRGVSMKVSPIAVGASILVQDSLQEGSSRFYAEITRLGSIVKKTEGETPVLFLLDEILHGTNSHDRRIGAEAVVKNLIERGAIGLVTTHDLALTKVADRLGAKAENAHFEDHIAEGEMTFDYILRPGVVEKSNALALMRAVGLDV